MYTQNFNLNKVSKEEFFSSLFNDGKYINVWKDLYVDLL